MNDQPNTNALAATPPMGWNSWNRFGDKVTEEVIRKAADAMVSTGMKDLGYTYVNIDDCWSDKKGRDANGDLVPDPERFPNGIKALADYVHGKGLKLGIYSDAAELTCAGWPGSYLHEKQDAAIFAAWGVDLLKYDYCYAPEDQATAVDRYTRMGDALRDCGRPILFSACEWGGREPHLWARKAGAQMWRVTGDVVDGWVTGVKWGLGIPAALDKGAALADYSGPGGWNDMDMLVVGCRGAGHTGDGCTDDEYRTHMSMWSILCSPLLAGNDLGAMDAAIASLLMNPEVIAVNQDPLGKQARLRSKRGELEVWSKPMADGSVAACLLNRSGAEEEVVASWSALGIPEAEERQVRDLWAKADVAAAHGSWSACVPAHGTVMIRL